VVALLLSPPTPNTHGNGGGAFRTSAVDHPKQRIAPPREMARLNNRIDNSSGSTPLEQSNRSRPDDWPWAMDEKAGLRKDQQPPAPANAVDRFRRKSHPWQTDVKLNRFSSSPSSRTQKSTLGWKQRMQERRAAFGNFAVPEADDDYEEEDEGGDDDDVESIGATEDSIRKEAVALLKSKGFDGLPNSPPRPTATSKAEEEAATESTPPPAAAKPLQQEILQQHYEDDLESVGAGASLASRERQKLKLEEIQSLRAQILEKQMLRRQLEPDYDEEELEEDERIRPISPPTGRPASDSGSNPSSSTEKALKRSSQSLAAWRVMKELKVRLVDVYTGDHKFVVAMGRKGLGGDGSSFQKPVVIDQNAFKKHKLHDEVQRRVSLVYTGDHHIVTNEILPEKNDSDDDEEEENKESSLDDNHQSSSCPSSPTRSSPGDIRQSFSDSFVAFDNFLQSRQAMIAAAENSEDENDDEWTEYTLEPSKQSEAGMLPTMPQLKSTTEDDDQSCWTEYTVEESKADSVRNGLGMLPNLKQRVNEDHADDQSCWTEYTIEDENSSKEQSGCHDDMWEDMRKTIKLSSVEKAALNVFLGDVPASDRAESERKDDVATEHYEEYTVIETSEGQPFRLPGQPQPRVPKEGDESYMEYTVQDGAVAADVSTSSQRRPSSARSICTGSFSSLPKSKGKAQQDDQSYMEFTVQESSAPTRPPSQRHLQPSADDQQSFVEYTVYDETFDDDDDDNAEDEMEESIHITNLQSHHMQNILSSRMFADMQLPSTLRQEQKQQDNADFNDASFPTITVGHHGDDDDMTQITFDNTMDDVVSTTQDHYHAMAYLNKETSSASGMKKAPITPSAGASGVHSQHTAPTDDESSSHNEVASFKSCISSESAKSVAKLLRRDIWSQDNSIVLAAIEKLGQEAEQGSHQRASIARYGGLLAIVRAMEMNANHVPIQVAACVALQKLAMDAETQLAIAEVGGIPAIAGAMKAHIEDLEVQKAACKTLLILTSRLGDENSSSTSSIDPTNADGVVSAISACMTKYVGQNDIQANGFGALANLCLDDRERLMELSKAGGLTAMTMALQSPWENKTDQHEAISTLSILLRSLAELDQ
jgi:hypothetical protein